MDSSARLRDVVEVAPVAGGSRILNAFVAGRQAERQQLAVQRERAQEMATFRRHTRPLNQGRMAMNPAAELQPAFPMVAGQRAFSAGTTDRLASGWSVFNTGINADLEAALPTLRARSRDWSMNTDAGARYLELVADNVVGCDPPRLQVRAKLRDGSDDMDEAANTAVEKAWARWCHRGLCEVTGQLTFGEVCRSVVQAAARDGEYLARKITDNRLDYGFQLQLLDVDRIDSSLNTAPAVRGANAIRLGMEVDALGRKVAVHLLNRHPGDAGAGLGPVGASDRVLMQNVLHGYILKRPEQVRGYPWCAAVLKRANTLNTYESYALTAAKFGAAKMGFYTVDKDAIENQAMTFETMKDATGELVADMEEGMLEALPPGVGFTGWDPKYPAEAFNGFVGEYKRDLAAGLGVAHHNLSGNMAGVNYSSARIAELSERRSWRAIQKWFIASFVRPVFEAWLRSALITGSVRLESGAPLPAERFSKFAEAASFQPPGWAWVDPEGDLKAAAMAATYDMRSLRAITDEQGVDLEDNLADKARLIARYKALDLPIPPWLSGGVAVTAGGAPKPSPAPAPAAQTEGTAA